MVEAPIRKLKLLSISELIETEEHCHDRALTLAGSILDCGFWLVPIATESSMLAVMDGHHRLNAAKIMGLSRVPCILMSYDTGGVVLKSWRDDILCSIKSISRLVKNSQKYPLKTTRHLFSPPITEVKIALSLLY